MIELAQLQSNETLKGLTEEQHNAILTLSNASEKDAIDRTYAEARSSIDNIVRETTGITKESNEKTSDYVSRVTKSLKSGNDESVRKIAELNRKIAEGSADAELKKQLEVVTAERDSARSEYGKLKTESEKTAAAHAAEIGNMKLEFAIGAAMGGINFDVNANETVKTAAKDAAVKALMGMNPAFAGDVLMFHDANGAPLSNKDNGFAPFTAKELLTAELTKWGVLAKTPGGAGGGQPKPGATTGAFAGCTTKMEARAMAGQKAVESGLRVNSQQYFDYINKMVADNRADYDKLPM